MPREPKQERSWKTREAILEAAAVEFHERGGFENSHMRAIAERAGVSVGSLYAHFADKQSLLLAVAKRNTDIDLEAVVGGFAGMVQYLERRAAGDSGLRDIVRRMVAEVFRVHRRRFALRHLTTSLAADDERFRDIFLDVERQVVPRAFEVLRILSADGNGRDLEAHAAVLVSAIDGVAYHQNLAPSPLGEDRLIEGLTDVVAAYIRSLMG